MLHHGSPHRVEELLLRDCAAAAVRDPVKVIGTRDPDGFGALPVKTEGDAVIAVAAFLENKGVPFLAAAFSVVTGEAWTNRLRDLQQAKGWPTETLGLRVTLAVGDVDWRPELRDIAGADVTALFRTSNAVKEILKRNSAAVALLGDWGPLAAKVTVGETTTVSDPKVRDGSAVAVRTVAAVPPAEATVAAASSET